MNKMSNGNSPLLESLIKAASNAKPQPKSTFAENLIKSIDTPVKPSLKELMKQVVKTARSNKISKTAQFSPDMGSQDMGSSMSPPEVSPEVSPDMSSQDPMSDASPDASPVPGKGEDSESAKSSLVAALIALCGGVEEAHACLDQNGGAAGATEEPGMSGEDEFSDPDFDEIPDLDLGAETGAESKDMSMPMSGSPSPMPASGGMSPPPMM